ncbi:uncharacterized protein APUU_80034A [Aspergillus puulaauensis]|uniref:Uncharacterized protein n=1 Tax=Aspergillus puulaauensis TaxID=1220207 RepID=A0A7R7XXV1_9EURO|nr:uncharacterized protein APUU_80034A [Aspergillus puulaauensis]BCS29731.1 hypothetical protein APUU_80034A [Aspergillus puulaauensis]
MSGNAPQGDADENDDVYTMDSNDEQERAPQRQPKAAKPAKAAKPTAVRQRPRRQKQKRDMISEDDDVQDESKAMQPYEGRRAQELSNKEASPAQAGERIQKQDQQQGEQVQGKEKEDTGLKLRLDLNLDIEVDLKASIHGDITLALLS